MCHGVMCRANKVMIRLWYDRRHESIQGEITEYEMKGMYPRSSKYAEKTKPEVSIAP